MERTICNHECGISFCPEFPWTLKIGSPNIADLGTFCLIFNPKPVLVLSLGECKGPLPALKSLCSDTSYTRKAIVF